MKYPISQKPSDLLRWSHFVLKMRNLFLAAITFEAYVSVHRTRQGYARKRILKPAGRFFSTQDIERIEA